MLQKLTAIWQTVKHLRQHTDPAISLRARTLLRNKMRLAKAPDDSKLQAQIKANVADMQAEIAKRAH